MSAVRVVAAFAADVLRAVVRGMVAMAGVLAVVLLLVALT